MSHTPDSHSDQDLDASLQLLRHCPLCQGEYQSEALSLVEQQDEASLVHMTCVECTNAVLAVVVVSPLGMNSVGIVTDLTVEDTHRLRTRATFTQDDVLDFHSGMQRQGSLETLLVQHEQLSNILSNCL